MKQRIIFIMMATALMFGCNDDSDSTSTTTDKPGTVITCQPGTHYSDEEKDCVPDDTHNTHVTHDEIDKTICSDDNDCKGDHMDVYSCDLEPSENKNYCSVVCQIGYHFDDTSTSKISCIEDNIHSCGGLDCTTELDNAEELSCVEGVCGVVKCEPGYHIEEGSIYTTCEEDSNYRCGDKLEDCSRQTGVWSGSCVKGKCVATECDGGYDLIDGECVACSDDIIAEAADGIYRNEEVKCINGNLLTNDNIKEIHMPNLISIRGGLYNLTKTQYDYQKDVFNTPELISYNFQGDSSPLRVLDLPKLKKSAQIVINGSELEELSMNSLSESDTIVLTNNSKLKKISLPALVKASDAYGQIGIVSNNACTKIDIPKLTKIYEIYIVGNELLSDISMPELRDVHGEYNEFYDMHNGTFSITNNPALASLKLNKVEALNELYLVNNTTLATTQMSALNAIYEVAVIKNNSVLSCDQICPIYSKLKKARTDSEVTDNAEAACSCK